MANRVQTLRSSTTRNVPATGTRQPGELWTNFPDLQIGVIDASQTAQRLLPIRFFSTTANYVAGEIVVQTGAIYVANGSITAGAFSPGQWTKIASLTDVPAGYVLPIASTTVLGGVKGDGATVSINGSGVISASSAVASSTPPLMDGAATVGAGTTYARADHIHPSDTSRLALTGGTLTGALTPSSTAGIVGTVTNDNASAGAIGEVVFFTSPSAVSMTTATVQNLLGISLTAGDWDVQGEVWSNVGAGGATQIQAAINSVSVTLPAAPSIATSRTAWTTAITASSVAVLPLRPCRVSLSATTTIFLIAYVVFPSGATTCIGNIWARRAR